VRRLDDIDETSTSAVAGRGRLAELLATRGGRAEPEAPFVIEHREALIYMLCQAAELEHGIMCQYLFAAFSLKQRTDEGLTPEELEAVTRWRDTIAHVATEEMLPPRTRAERAVGDRCGASSDPASRPTPTASSSGTMPCDGAWPAERVAVFRAWIDAGKPA
jgi:ferritin-like protein